MSEESKHKEKQGSAKIGAVIILIISAIVFIPAGGSLVFQAIANSGKIPVFGSYKGKKIEYKPGTEMFNNVSNQAEMFKHNYGTVSQDAYYRIFYAAFGQTLSSMIYTDAVTKTGYSVPKAAVNRAIIGYFTDASGNYSSKIYNQTDESTKKSLRQAAEKSLISSLYRTDVFGSSTEVSAGKMYGIKSSSKEKAFIANMESEKKSFELVAFSTETFPEEEAVKYANNNAEKFAKYNISAVTLENKDAAESLLKQIKNNEVTFDDAISEKSVKYYTDKEGKLSTPYHYQLLKDVENEEDVAKIAVLKPQELSEVIQNRSGYSIYRCDGEVTKADFSDAATVKVVQSYLTANEKGYIENYYIEMAKSFKNEVALSSFEEACNKFQKTRVEVPAFALNYYNTSFYSASPSNIPEIASISGNVNALQALFSLKAEQASDPFVLASNVIVARCTGIQKDPPASTENFDATAEKADSSSASSALQKLDGVEDKFIETYFNYFVSNSQDEE